MMCSNLIHGFSMPRADTIFECTLIGRGPEVCNNPTQKQSTSHFKTINDFALLHLEIRSAGGTLFPRSTKFFLLFQKHTRLIEYRFGDGVGMDTAHFKARLQLATPDKVTNFYNNSSSACCAKQNFTTILGHCPQGSICFLQILLLLV